MMFLFIKQLPLQICKSSINAKTWLAPSSNIPGEVHVRMKRHNLHSISHMLSRSQVQLESCWLPAGRACHSRTRKATAPSMLTNVAHVITG